MKDPQTIQLFLSISIAIIMLGMGLSLQVEDFLRIKKSPKGVFTGLFNQLILLPLIGFGVISTLGLEAEYAVGVVLISACPGGATSNLITNLAKGDVGLSVTLTAFSATITVFTIPLLVNFALGKYMDTEETIVLEFWSVFLKMVTVTLIPVAAGMFIRNKAKKFAGRMETPVKIASVLLMAGIITGAVLANKSTLWVGIQSVGPAIIALNLIAMIIGFISGKLFQSELRQRISISIECGIQNGSLALFIGSLGVMANYPKILLVPALYGVLMFFTGGIFAVVYARWVNKVQKRLL